MRSWLTQSWRLLKQGGLLLSLSLASCVVSPQPSPPGEDPDLDGDGIDIVGAGTEDLNELLTFDAAPGSVDPAKGVVIVTNLERSDAPSRVVVRDDGSFSVALAGFPGDTVRFQVDQDGARSQPVDIAVDATGQVVDVVEDAPACLAIDPARFVALSGAGDAQSIVVRNECEVAVLIDAPRLRRGRGPFTFSPTGALSLEPGEAGFVTVRAVGAADEREDVLFFDVSAPEPARRAITLTVPE
ncbi:MAG: hypothetical protein IPM79_23730 [Polyangiaceae bacterium]|nr:hypothetical protein [Polyangiaceae bacterium]